MSSSVPASRLGLLLALVVLGMALGAPVAGAGTYDVVACDAAGGANNSWAATINDANAVTAYTSCPTGGDPWRGIIARNAVVQNGGAGPVVAMMKFTAAPGTTIVGINAAYDFYRSDAHWEAVLSTGSQALRGCPVGGVNVCALSSAGESIAVPNSSVLYIDVACPTTGCPLAAGDAAHNYLSAYARLASASVRLQDDSAPVMNSVTGSLWSNGWKSGSQTLTVDASDNAGIRRTAVYLDGQLLTANNRACDGSQVVPCPNGTDTFPLSLAPISDGGHRLTVQAIDSAGNTNSASRDILVDNTAPGPPQKLAVDGGEDWKSRNSFDLHWTNPTSAGSPNAGVNWQICPAAGTQSCVSGVKDGAKVETLNAVTVPKDGDWALKLWERDAASNNTINNGVTVHLRLDTEAPTAVFSPIDRADPTRVLVQASDATSGIGAGSIDYKRHDSESWTSIPAKVDGGRLVANLPDETMGDGLYDLRAHAVDRAGNERSTTTLADGTPMTVTLPLRSPTRITGGRLQTRHRQGKRVRYLATRLRLAYAHRTKLRGRLADKDNKSMPGTPIAVSELIDVPGAAWHPVRTITTNASGTYNFCTAKRGPSRTLRIRYEGTPTVRPSQVDVHLAVAASSTIHVSKRRVRSGHAVRFSGNLRGGHVPAGMTLQVQVRLGGGRWQTFATPRVKRNGKWTSVYKFTGGPRRWTFRARIPPHPGYPFRTGHSSHKTVHVLSK